MSIRSTPYPLNSKVKIEDSPSPTHVNHMTQQEYYEKLVPERLKSVSFSAAQSKDLMSLNYLDDRKLCSLEPSAFGQISGCSVHHQDIFKNPQPDFVEKISDTSFSSQLFKSHYGTINQDAARLKKNDIKKTREALPYTMVPGLELKKGLQLNRIDGLPEDMDDKDLYESYCHKKYRNKLFSADYAKKK